MIRCYGIYAHGTDECVKSFDFAPFDYSQGAFTLPQKLLYCFWILLNSEMFGLTRMEPFTSTTGYIITARSG